MAGLSVRGREQYLVYKPDQIRSFLFIKKTASAQEKQYVVVLPRAISRNDAINEVGDILRNTSRMTWIWVVSEQLNQGKVEVLSHALLIVHSETKRNLFNIRRSRGICLMLLRVWSVDHQRAADLFHTVCQHSDCGDVRRLGGDICVNYR